MIAGLLSMVREPLGPAERARYVDTVVSMICDPSAKGAGPAEAG